MSEFMSLTKNSTIFKISSSLQQIFNKVVEYRDHGVPESNIKEIQFLKELCKADNVQICLMSCHTFVRLVKKRAIELDSTLSIFIAMLPSSDFEQYSVISEGIISLLMIDIKQKIALLTPNMKFEYVSGLTAPQHPLIRIIQKNGSNMINIANKINGICNHHDTEIKSHSIAFLRPVFLYIFCNPEPLHDSNTIWTGLLARSTSSSEALELIQEVLSWSRISTPQTCLHTRSLVVEAINTFLFTNEYQLAVDLILYLAVIVNYEIAYGINPCISLHCITQVLHSTQKIEKNFYNILLVLLANTLHIIYPIYLLELMRILFFIIVTEQCANKYILNMILDGIIQWMSQTDFITSDASSLASHIVNKIVGLDASEFGSSISTKKFKSNARSYHSDIAIAFDIAKLAEQFETAEHKNVFTFVDMLNTKYDIEFSKRINLFLRALFLSKDISIDCWFKLYQLILWIVKNGEDIAADFMMTFIFKLSKETNPETQLELLRGLPSFAIAKDNIPMILNTIKAFRSGPNVTLCMDLHLKLWKLENRTYPFLHKALCEGYNKKCSEWEWHIAKVSTIREICIAQPSQYGADLISTLSDILNLCSTEDGDLSTAIALDAITSLCESNTVNIVSTWKALAGKFRHEKRIESLKSLFKFFSNVPVLYTPTAEHEKLVDDALDLLWFIIMRCDNVELIKAALKTLPNYEIGRIMFLKHMPQKLLSECKNIRVDSSDDLEVKLYMENIPGECWVQLLRKINPNCIPEVADLISHYIEVEILSYRSGVYRLPEGKPEPKALMTLSKESPLRAVVHYLTQQSRLGDQINEPVVVENALRAISKKFSKPIPPLDWCFLHSFFHIRFETRKYCILIAKNQTQHSGTAKRLLENYLMEFEPNCFEEDLQLLLNLLPDFAERVSTHVLKTFVDRVAIYCFKESQINGFKESCMFQKFLESVLLVFTVHCSVPEALDIFTLVVERYIDLLDLDSRLFEKYTEIVSALHPKSIDNITSPSSWRKVPVEKLKKATVIRCYLVLYNTQLDNPLTWLSPIIDAFTETINEQSFFLQHLAVTLYAFNDNKNVFNWIMDILRKIQALLANSTKNEKHKNIIFLLDIFVVSIVAFSGCGVFMGNLEYAATTRISWMEVFPESLQILCEKVFWKDNEAKISDTLLHMFKNAFIPDDYSIMFRNAILCFRHKSYFENKLIWTKFVGMRN